MIALHESTDGRWMCLLWLVTGQMRWLLEWLICKIWGWRHETTYEQEMILQYQTNPTTKLLWKGFPDWSGKMKKRDAWGFQSRLWRTDIVLTDQAATRVQPYIRWPLAYRICKPSLSWWEIFSIPQDIPKNLAQLSMGEGIIRRCVFLFDASRRRRWQHEQIAKQEIVNFGRTRGLLRSHCDTASKPLNCKPLEVAQLR